MLNRWFDLCSGTRNYYNNLVLQWNLPRNAGSPFVLFYFSDLNANYIVYRLFSPGELVEVDCRY